MNNLNDDVLNQILYFGRETIESKVNDMKNLHTLHQLNRQVLKRIDELYNLLNLKNGSVYKIKYTLKLPNQAPTICEDLFLITKIKAYWFEMCKVKESDTQRLFGKFEIIERIIFVDKTDIYSCVLIYEPPPVDITIFQIVGVSVHPSLIKKLFHNDNVAHANRNWRGRIIKINKTTIRLEGDDGDEFSVNRTQIFNLISTD
jgi:hypothetical protein